jgi:galactose-1-phosphate uridylyltransferase
MRPNARLPHEITIYPKGHVPEEENVEVVEVEEAAPKEAKE